ncbi:MAG: ABC transporter ATP-binding protein [Burkholderiaceae bacterium]
MSTSNVSRYHPHADHAPEADRRDLVLEVQELRAGYGDLPVLQGASLQVREGEALGIVGHNGAGKTTLLRTIIGHLKTRGGRVIVDGQDVSGSPAHHRARMGIGYVPQGRGILPGLTALENLRIAWTQDTGESEEAALDRVLTSFPRLGSILDRKGASLSGGEQQILALGRAMMSDPWMLLLDEPSEGIQPSIVEEIGKILAHLRDKQKLSLIIVEQNLDLVLDVADRVVVFERGQVAQEVGQAQLRGGGLAELLGMGAARITRTPASGSARGASAVAVRSPDASGTVGVRGAAASRPAVGAGHLFDRHTPVRLHQSHGLQGNPRRARAILASTTFPNHRHRGHPSSHGQSQTSIARSATGHRTLAPYEHDRA